MIFLKNKDFILEFFMDVINVIDFLVNFELILVEEVWIFKYLVMYIVIKFVVLGIFLFFLLLMKFRIFLNILMVEKFLIS